MNYISHQVATAAAHEGRLEAGIVAVLFFGQRETSEQIGNVIQSRKDSSGGKLNKRNNTKKVS